MNNIIFFIYEIYSDYLIASKPIKQYAADNITDLYINVEKASNVIFVKSNLIGLTDDIINDFISKKASEEILLGTVDGQVCIIRANGNIVNNIMPNKDSVFDNIKAKWPVYDLNSYHLKLINNMAKLVDFEQEIQNNLRKNAIDQGVFLQDPASTYLSFNTKFGKGVIVESHVYFQANVEIQDNVHIKAFSYLEGVRIENNASIGPFARIRGNSVIGTEARIGNFVEIKNSTIDFSSKIGHLSYIGDAKIGKNVNIGAGVVTCNYDGFGKHKTIIGDGTFVGSNSAVIAPIIIGSNSLIGAGSFINKNVPDQTFATGRSKQQMTINKRK
jgi:bifunctional UDP-N-acetylglucosamine pyrophosphorylase/glucosamine-1-phosphate N-acetyltransferase